MCRMQLGAGPAPAHWFGVARTQRPLQEGELGGLHAVVCALIVAATYLGARADRRASSMSPRVRMLRVIDMANRSHARPSGAHGYQVAGGRLAVLTALQTICECQKNPKRWSRP